MCYNWFENVRKRKLRIFSKKMVKRYCKFFKKYYNVIAMVQRSPIPKMGAMGTGGASGATYIAYLLLGVKYRGSKF